MIVRDVILLLSKSLVETLEHVVQMVSAVCQFPTVKSAVEATVAVIQSSIPVARIGLCLPPHHVCDLLSCLFLLD